MDNQATALPILVTMFASAIVYLYKRQTDSETKRAERAEAKVEKLQAVIDKRSDESERLSAEITKENTELRREMALLLKQSVGRE